MLRKADRLASRDTDRLSKGKSVFGTLVSIRFVAADRTKMSVVVSKKVSPTAASRNRIRRRVYAALRGVYKDVGNPVFVMVFPKKECAEASLRAIQDDLKSLFNKAGLSC